MIERGMVRRDQYMKDNFGETDEKNFSDDSAADGSRYAGIVAGQKTEIRGGLNPAQAPTRPALPPAAGQLALI